MMLSPRSFLFTRPSPKSAESKYERPQSRKSEAMATTTSIPRPTTPSSPVVIPTRSQRTSKRDHHGRDSSARRTRQPSDLVPMPPSVAALLAITSIPLQKSNSTARYRSGAGQRLTVDAILQHTGDSEKEPGMLFGRNRTLDFLLGPPEDLDEEVAGSENGRASVASMRTLSSDSMPSLDSESISEMSPSFSSITTPASRGRRSLPSRRRLLSVSSIGEATDVDHPLSVPEIDVEELDFRVFNEYKVEEKAAEDLSLGGKDIDPPRLKSAFKSNLTASLRALRSAAKSLSSLTSPMITPDDFLTRSIISIDPRVPFTDERMPPRLEDTPTPALRRYLNPTTNAPIEAHVSSSLTQTMSSTQCTASIQMQTYKVSHPKKGTSAIVISRRTQSTSEEANTEVVAGPVARQRDMRENSDFIRVAVMEMAMRKKGKLDDQKPGRARWALPPRKPPTRPYEISENGVPVRWIAVTH